MFHRGCVVRLTLDEGVPGGIVVDVSDMTEDCLLFDQYGQHIALEAPREVREGSWLGLLPIWGSTEEEARPSRPDTSPTVRRPGEGLEGSMEHRVWEWQILNLAPVPREEDILGAWYGHPANPTKRVDITDHVRNLAAKARANHGAGMAIAASNVEFGDPAWFVWKQMSVVLRGHSESTADSTARQQKKK